MFVVTPCSAHSTTTPTRPWIHNDRTFGFFEQ
jgi:hypothetical protein